VACEAKLPDQPDVPAEPARTTFPTGAPYEAHAVFGRRLQRGTGLRTGAVACDPAQYRTKVSRRMTGRIAIALLVKNLRDVSPTSAVTGKASRAWRRLTKLALP